MSLKMRVPGAHAAHTVTNRISPDAAAICAPELPGGLRPLRDKHDADDA
jgi:hypothetical protein